MRMSARDQDTFEITCDYSERRAAELVGRHRLSEFGAEFVRLIRSGQPFIVEDAETDPRTQSVLDQLSRGADSLGDLRPAGQGRPLVRGHVRSSPRAAALATGRGRAVATGREPLLGIDRARSAFPTSCTS